jgi:competence protein ComEA
MQRFGGHPTIHVVGPFGPKEMLMQSFETRSPAVRSFAMFVRALLLSLVLTGTAMAAETVNINTADAATLDRVLLNVGPSKAEAIVAYRKANGPFKTAEQLAQVKGIGLKTVEKNIDRIVVGGGAPAAKPATAARPGAAPARPATAQKPPAPARR